MNLLDNEQYFNFLTRLIYQQLDVVQKEIAEHCDKFGKTLEEMDEDFSNVIGMETQRRIEDIQNTKDLISKNRKKVALSAWLYRFIPDRKQVETTIAAYSREDSPAEFYSLGELIQLKNTTPSKSLVKGLLPLGDLILLAAGAKVGKSLFATKLAIAISLGKPFLNRQTLQGNVLYIQNEENLGKTTTPRLLSGGLQDLELIDYEAYQEMINSSRITVARNLDIVLDRELLLEKVLDLNCNLVLIDSLNASIERAGLTDTSVETAGYLYALQRLAQKHDFTILLLHHTTKLDNNSTQQSAMDGISGRSAIGRANGGNFKLSRVENKETKEIHIQLNTIPRDGDPVTIKYKIVKGEANSWGFQIIEESSITPENLELQNKILRLLLNRWEDWNNKYIDVDIEERPLVYGLSKYDIVSLTGSPEEEVVARLNDMLGSEGIIYYCDHSIKKWIYAIHPSGESWLTYYLEQEEHIEQRKKERIEQQQLEKELINRTAQLLKEAIQEKDRTKLDQILSSLTEPNKKKEVEKLLSSEELEKIWLIYYPSQFNVGDIVTIVHENISSIVNKVVFHKQNKYHMYYLEAYADRVFRHEQLILGNTLNETNCEIGDDREL